MSTPPAPEALPPTLADRVLVHLLAHPAAPDAAVVPHDVTQEGIAEALGAQVAHVSRAIKALAERGHVAAHLAHPQGAKRRSRAHTLTPAGRAEALRVKPEVDAGALAAPRDEREAVKPPAGRARELAALVGALEDAQKGGPRVALVEGDSGSGKTRLLQAFRAEAVRRGARVLEGAGAPVGSVQELGPVAAALEPVGFERRYRARAAGTPRERALAAAVDALQAAQRDAPVALLLDDLHLAGPTVVEFLHGLVRALPAGSRVLLVASFRREEAWALPNGPLYTALDPLRGMRGALHLPLEELDREGLAALLRDAGAHHVDDALLDRVARESGGNPLYALAMAEALADGVDEDDFFPQAVRETARARLADLPEEAIEALQLAAVAGAEVGYALLARAHAGDEAGLVRALDVLLDRLLLEEAPREDEELHLRFEHPKVREAVLADLAATRRRWLEGRVARAHQDA